MTQHPLCIWPHHGCPCPECDDRPYNDRSNESDRAFGKAVAAFYDDTEPTIDSQWDERDG